MRTIYLIYNILLLDDIENLIRFLVIIASLVINIFLLVKTKNIWYCVVLHAVYNFAGGIVPECGGGAIWTIPTVILTAVVAVIVAAYVIYMLIRISPHDVEALLNDSIKNEQNNIELKNNVENKC